jgi:hypothetical protein
MQFSLRIIQLIILTSSPTLASDYALPLHLVSRQSSVECLPIWLLYPGTWASCGNGYISPLCTCCGPDDVIGCLTLTQTCAMDAVGGSICCDNTSPDCSSTPGGGGDCATEGKVSCGNGCLPAGYTCCSIDVGGGCSSEQYCCYPDGKLSCCVGNIDTLSPSNTATGQSPDSLTSPTSGAAPTSRATPTPTESFNFGTGSSTTISAKMTSNDVTSTVISGPSSSISKSSSTRVYVVGATRGSHSFIFQPAMPFIVIYYFLLIGIFA